MCVIRHGYQAVLMIPQKAKIKEIDSQDTLAFNPDATELNLPDIEGAEYLVELLHEAGPVGSNGYGVEGLKWSEIK